MLYNEIFECLDVPLTAAAKAAFSIIAIKAHPDTAIAAVKIEQIAHWTSCSVSKVKRGIWELEKNRLITRTSVKGRGLQNTYKVHLEAVHAQMASLQGNKTVHSEPFSENDGNKTVHSDPKTVHSDPKTVHYDPPNEEKNLNNGALAGLPTHVASTVPVSTSKKRNNGSPVNRAFSTGRGVSRPPGKQRGDTHLAGLPATSDVTAGQRDVWSHCLHADTARFGLPDSAILGSIEHGKATIYDLSPFHQSFLRKDAPSSLDKLATSLSRLLGEKVRIETPRQGWRAAA